MLYLIATYYARKALNCTPYGFLVYLTSLLITTGGNLRSQ